jgi:hypothetical protein
MKELYSLGRITAVSVKKPYTDRNIYFNYRQKIHTAFRTGL